MQQEITDGFRLSPQQEHLWLQQQSGRRLPYRVQCAVLIEGNLNVKTLYGALESVVERHEILRTTFHCLPGMAIPVQLISKSYAPLVHEHDLSGLDDQEQGAEIEALFHEVGQRAFNLEQGPLLHISLVVLSSRKHVLLVSLPALCADKAALKNLVHEIKRCYLTCLHQREPLDEALQYADLAEWQNELLEAADEETGREYWRRRQNALLNLELPFENRSSGNAEFEPRFLPSTINLETAAQIKTLAQKYGVSVPAFLLTCWQILLWRLTGQTDLAVGTYCDGRKYQELEEALGLFAKYAPLHGHLGENLKFNELLKQVDETAHDVYKWQEYFTWEQVKDLSNDIKQTAFFAYCFDFDDQSAAPIIADLSFSISNQYACIDRFKVKVSCVDVGDSLTAEFHYDSELFSREDIERLAGQFQQLLESAANRPESVISELEILSAVERQRLLVGFNDTKIDYLKDKCVHQLFEEKAANTPDKIAVVCEDRQLTYAELNAHSNQLAHHLQALGVGPEVVVAICVERSLEMVTGILGILKAGGAYVPLDPAYPKDRLAFMFKDARPQILLTQARLLGGLPEQKAQVVLLDTDWPLISQQSKENLSGRVAATENLAYVIYTSGSTGKPKGVMNTHPNLGHYVQSIRVPLRVAADDFYLHTASISFSSSVRQLMLPLSLGASVVIATAEEIRNPLALFDAIKQHEVTIADLVPSYWRNCIHALASLQPPSKKALLDNKLRLILSASEPLWSDVPRDWAFVLKHGARLLNMFGQTETAGIVSVHPIPAECDEKVKVVPIGRPIGNTQIYLLDSHLRPVPVGLPGEVHIGGAGVGRGYLNHPELTAEKFIRNPFSDEPEARLYKTGDLGRYRPDGQIEFLGRIDDQVKIRGHRVEPGEIEAVLREYPGVCDAVVLARDDGCSNQRLVAYAVPEKAYAPSISGRERYQLPNNMAVVQQNKHETDFFYQQIFVDQTNFRHGITLRDGDCVFDVGANIGLFTLFVQQTWKDIAVYAFEPIPTIFEALSINSSLYGKNVKLFQCGLADEAKDAEFTFYPHSSTQSGRYANTRDDREVLRSIIANQQQKSGATIAPVDQYLDEVVEGRVKGQSVVCQLKTLSEIIRENGIERIDLLKIDVEKSEGDVLAGVAENDWEKIEQIVIEAHDMDGQLDRITGLLRKHGYTVVAEQDTYLKGSRLYNVYATRCQGTAASRNWGRDNGPYHVPALKYTVLSSSELRRHLQEKLPGYMLPSVFVFLDSLPLLPNGKVDRHALPAPDRERAQMERDFVAARTPVEKALAKIWAEVLKLERVDVHDNFFDLGGDSILGIQIVARALQVGIRLTPKHLFQRHTIAELSAVAGTIQSTPAGQRPVISSASSAPKVGSYAPVDFPKAKLSQKDLDRIIARINRTGGGGPNGNRES